MHLSAVVVDEAATRDSRFRIPSEVSVCTVEESRKPCSAIHPALTHKVAGNGLLAHNGMPYKYLLTPPTHECKVGPIAARAWFQGDNTATPAKPMVAAVMYWNVLVNASTMS